MDQHLIQCHPPRQDPPFRNDPEILASFSEGQKLLGQELEILDRWLDDLKDPAWGDAGKELKTAFRATGCKEFFSSAADGICKAHYLHYLAHKETTFSYLANQIRYLPLSFSTRGALYNTRLHEMIHSVQFYNAAVLHATIYNHFSPIILCPAHEGLLITIMERDAYAKETWLTSLADSKISDSDELGTFMLPAVFSLIRNSGLSLKSSLMVAFAIATDSDSLEIPSVRDNRYYHQNLSDYSKLVGLRMEDLQSGGAVLARLDAEDLVEICNSFGPSFISKDEINALKLFSLKWSDQNHAQVEELNKKLGIEDTDQLPTFSEALNQKGFNRASFIKWNYSLSHPGME